MGVFYQLAVRKGCPQQKALKCLSALPESVDKNIFEMTSVEKKAAGIESLPSSLWEAVLELEKDEFIKNVLGEHLCGHYIRAKKEEWVQYSRHVSAWELEQYLYRI